MEINSKFFHLSLLGIPALLSSGCEMQQGKAVPPNIIVVLADDQGWGDMAYNGHPVLETPNFDNLAATGLRFDRFYAAAPVCSPTRGSIMTGRHPNRFGCFSWGHTLRPREITVAEKLQEAGYVTGHFGKWHLGPVYKGSPVNPGSSGFDEWFSSPNFFENDPVLSREGVAVQTHGESSAVTMDAALEFIEKHKDGQSPFFAYVCFGSPHQPHVAAEQDKELYSGQSEKLRNFYGEITGMDRAVGRLREELKKMGIDKNTVLWYLSDNGGLPQVGSAGGREYKGSVYEGGLRVPSIIEWPAVIKENRITKIPCSTVDILPTLLEIAGAGTEELPVLDGISLVPLLHNKMEERDKPVYFWKHPTGGRPVAAKQIMDDLLSKQQSEQPELETSLLHLDADEISVKYPKDTLPGHAAVLSWPYKLHRIYDPEAGVKFELYDLEADSAESLNIAENHPDILKTMSNQIEGWMESVVGSLNGEDYPDNPREEFSSFFEPPAEYKSDFGNYPSPLKFYDGREVKTAEEWALRRQEILDRWHEMMGEWPGLITDQEFEFLEKEELDGYVQHKVRFRWLPDEATEGYLLIPGGDGKKPAVITVYYEPETAKG
ncbi:MAG: sulfatase-like hydrolase/transferase, partial [Prolixibacteraceae bacterium]|nr:sulfatase-like hydrolase/transferase [Prolixibacteraceae bacterium]